MFSVAWVILTSERGEGECSVGQQGGVHDQEAAGEVGKQESGHGENVNSSNMSLHKKA